MYADDIALISDTIVGLQRQFNRLSEFCDNFKPTVNVLKTKILVFKNGGVQSRAEKWFYKGTCLELVNDLHMLDYYSLQNCL